VLRGKFEDLVAALSLSTHQAHALQAIMSSKPFTRSQARAAAAAAPPCPYAEYQYKDIAKPERRSQRINTIFKRKVESIVGAAAFSEWTSSLAKNLAALEVLPDRDSNYNSRINRLITLITTYKTFLESPVTSVILRHHPFFRETSMGKAADLHQHCDNVYGHVVSTGCNCYAAYTDLQKSTIRLLLVELKGLCEKYLAMKY
jgi:hypothetical protein